MKKFPLLVVVAVIVTAASLNAQTTTVIAKSGDLLPSLTISNAQLLWFGSPTYNELEEIAFTGYVRQTNRITNPVYVTNRVYSTNYITVTNPLVTRVVTNVLTTTNRYTLNGTNFTYTNTIPQYGSQTNFIVTNRPVVTLTNLVQLTNRVISTYTNWYGMWTSDTNGSFSTVISSGSPAPGTDGTFTYFSDPSFNNSNAVAFIGYASAPSISTNTNTFTTVTNGKSITGIWTTQPFGGSNALTPVAFLGSNAPGTTNTFTYFQQIALPDQGGGVLLGTAGGKQGIWAQDTMGALKLIAIQGGAFAVGTNSKTISYVQFLTSGGSVGGQTRSFSQDTGNLLYKAIFTDGSQAVIRVTFP